VSDPEKILCKAKEQILDLFYYLDKNLSLPKDGVQSIDDLDFDTLFEQTLFRSKSESYLDKIVFNEKRFQYLIPNKPPQTSIIPTRTTQKDKNPPRVMAARFAPLSLPSQLHDFPQNYNKRIKLYDAEGNASAQNHLDWFNDFVDLEEVDHEDAKMRLFVQSLSGEVKKCFKAL
jgi:hypothetical protein